MLGLDEQQHRRFADSVAAARRHGDVASAVLKVYEDVALQVATRKPRCDASGRCCRFEEWGHRLFVTTIEAAAFVSALPSPGRTSRSWDGCGCPFQVGGLCSVYAIRPFGCRVYFCDSTSSRWQTEVYERLHARLKRLHEELDLTYLYVEWREALRALGIATPDAPGVRTARTSRVALRVLHST